MSSKMSSELAFARGSSAVPLTIKVSARARRMRLSVDPRTAQVLLTVPKRTSQRKALAWAESQRSWIESALAKVPDAIAIGPGSEVPLYGAPHPIDWRETGSRTVQAVDGRLVVGGPKELVQQRVLRWLRHHALDVLHRETMAYAAKAGVSVSKVTVGDPVSRWGSCSSSGGIRYSWRLILAPDFVRRATVAHEVAHRMHMDHSPAFHAVVADILEDDPGQARRWLRTHGAELHRFARN
jgi:predicted metal-dependent hydrolase